MTAERGVLIPNPAAGIVRLRLINGVAVSIGEDEGELSATFDKVTELAPELQSMIFGAALDGLRDQAWAFATQLSSADNDERRIQLIDERSALIDRCRSEAVRPR